MHLTKVEIWVVENNKNKKQKKMSRFSYRNNILVYSSLSLFLSRNKNKT